MTNTDLKTGMIMGPLSQQRDDQKVSHWHDLQSKTEHSMGPLIFLFEVYRFQNWMRDSRRRAGKTTFSHPVSPVCMLRGLAPR